MSGATPAGRPATLGTIISRPATLGTIGGHLRLRGVQDEHEEQLEVNIPGFADGWGFRLCRWIK